MLKIRLQRIGRINSPSYRIIVTEHTRGPKTGNFVEKLGSYNPKTKERTLNADRIKYWISVGAQPSDTMHNMLVTEGVITGKKINVLPKKTVAKVEEPVVEAPVVAAAPAPVVEAPATVATPVVETVVEEAPAVVEETPVETITDAVAEEVAAE